MVLPLYSELGILYQIVVQIRTQMMPISTSFHKALLLLTINLAQQQQIP